MVEAVVAHPSAYTQAVRDLMTSFGVLCADFCNDAHEMIDLRIIDKKKIKNFKDAFKNYALNPSVDDRTKAYARGEPTPSIAFQGVDQASWRKFSQKTFPELEAFWNDIKGWRRKVTDADLYRLKRLKGFFEEYIPKYTGVMIDDYKIDVA